MFFRDIENSKHDVASNLVGIPIPDILPEPHWTRFDTSPNLIELLRLREKVHAKRITVAEERKRTLEYRKRTATFRQKLYSLGIEFTEGLEPHPVRALWNETWNSYQESYQHQITHEEILQNFEVKLMKLESTLDSQEAKFFKDLKDWHSWSDNEANDKEADDFLSPSTYKACHPLEREYYDRIGDVNIFRERLFNFESEHQRNVLLRNAEIADGAGQNTSGSESEFYERYISERGTLIRGYSSAKRDVKSLSSKCREAGLKVGEPNFPPEEPEEFQERVVRYARPEKSEFTEYVMPGAINGASVEACPDSGSMFDIVSRKLTHKYGWAVDSTKREIISLPNRKKLRSLGTIEAEFQFRGEKKSYKRIFHVLDNCIHDVILGNGFLKITQTLTKFVHRIKEIVMEKTRKYRLQYLGTPRERFRCSLKNQSIWALGDTGADLTFVSSRLCTRLNLPIQKHRDYRVLVELADGSLVETLGVVLNEHLSFGDGTGDQHRQHLHVLDDPPCDLILGKRLLFETDAFSRYEEHFYAQVPEDELLDVDTISSLNVFKLKKASNKLFELLGFKSLPQKVPAQMQSCTKKDQGFAAEVHRRNLADTAILRLPPAEQEQARNRETAHREQWEETYNPP